MLGRGPSQGRPSHWEPRGGGSQTAEPGVRGWGSDVDTRGPTAAGEAARGPRSSPPSRPGSRALDRAGPSRERGPGPRGGGPASQIMGISAPSLPPPPGLPGSQSDGSVAALSQHEGWAHGASGLGTCVSPIPSRGGGDGAGRSRSCFPPPQSKQRGQRPGPASLWPEPACVWAGEEGLPAPEMSSGFSAALGGCGEGCPGQACVGFVGGLGRGLPWEACGR